MARRRRLVVLAVAGAAAIAAAAVVAAERFSGAGETAHACTPRPETVRLPRGGASRAGRWLALTPLPDSRDEPRGAAVGGLVYLGTGLEPGGSAGLRSAAETWAYDPSAREYRELPALPVRLDHAAVVSHREQLYVAGGWRDSTPSAVLFRYSPGSRRWERAGRMPVALGAPAAAVIGERLFVVGGSESRRDFVGEPVPSAVLEIFDFRTGRWTRGPDMPTPRHHHSAAALGGKLYVVGGRNVMDYSLDTVEVFDPRSGRWSQAPRLPLGSGGLGTVSAAGAIVAVGGGDDREGWVTPAAWALRPGQGWTRLADLNVPRHGHATVALGSTVYVFGGAPCPGYGRTDAAEALRLPGARGG